MATPTQNFIPGDTVYGIRSYLRFVPLVNGVAGTPVEAVTKMLDNDASNELAKRMRPGADGVLRPDRIVRKSAEESFSFEIEELKKGAAFLGGNRLNGLVKGTFTIWITDPDDLDGKVKLKSEEFAGVITREGNMAFNDDFSKMKLKVTSSADHDIVFAFDGNA